MNSNCVFIIFLNLLLILTDGSLEYTNVKCKTFDPSFATFEKCNLKVIQRGLVAANLHVKLLQIPVNNISINLAILRKYNDYQPFMYNVTTDFCKFMANRNKNLFLKIFFDSLSNYSNINHTCPYNHDIIAQNVIFTEEMFEVIPLQSAEYMFSLKVGAYNHWKADIKVYFTQKENFYRNSRL